MKLVFAIVASIAFFALLAIIATVVTAPIGFHANEVYEWLIDRVGERWAIFVSGLLGIVAAISAAVVVIGSPVALIAWWTKRR